MQRRRAFERVAEDPPHVARDHHSPSGRALIIRCERAAAYRYIDGITEPRVSWAQVEAHPDKYDARVRAAALGTEAHAIAEAHYRFEDVGDRWESRPGILMHSMIPHAPERGPDVKAEGEISVRLFGLDWLAYVDLDDPETTLDWKTTSNIAQWGKTAADLEQDFAANLYLLRAMDLRGTDRRKGRWIYGQTKGSGRVLPVDFSVTRAHATEIVEAGAEDCKRFDLLERSIDAMPNPRACFDFRATCPHHHSIGGPCSARRPDGKRLFGALVQTCTIKKKDPVMASALEEARAKFAAKAKGGAAAATTAPPVETTGEETPEPGDPPADPAPTKPAPRVGGKRATAAPTGTGLAVTFAALTADLAAAETDRDAASARIEAVRAKMREALA